MQPNHTSLKPKLYTQSQNNVNDALSHKQECRIAASMSITPARTGAVPR
jgi:hypothetical protein